MASFFTSITVLATLFYLNSCLAARVGPGYEANTQFIKTACGGTTYPNLCFTTLSSHATQIQASPKLLATTALSLTLNTTRSASKLLIKLSKTQGLKVREAEALGDCMDEASDSMYQIQKSINEMDSPGDMNLALQINDVQTWVSAALTDAETCMDGISEITMNGNLKSSVRRIVVSVAHMTSNALALVNNYGAAAQNA